MCTSAYQCVFTKGKLGPIGGGRVVFWEIQGSVNANRRYYKVKSTRQISEGKVRGGGRIIPLERAKISKTGSLSRCLTADLIGSTEEDN